MTKKCKQIDICRDKGDTFPERIFVWSILDGTPIDITTGYTFFLAVSATVDVDPDASSNFLFIIDGVLVSASDGQVEFPPSVGEAAIVGENFYEIWMVDPNSKKRTIRKGRYIVA